MKIFMEKIMLDVWIVILQDYNPKECFKKYEGSTNRIAEDNCIEKCPGFLFEQTEIINSETITKLYCLSKCADEARSYYTNIQNPEKILKAM